MRPGEVIEGRFEIERRVGSGGMGTVFRARDLDTGADAAVKVLHADGGPRETERFLREMRLLAGLRHPGIVAHVADGRTANGELYLALEWIEGEELTRRLDRGAMPIGEAVAVGVAVAEALAAAHAAGVVHRDIKPQNLILAGGSPARTKLCDFGIAHLADGELELTETGTVIGTPGYLAPEQARGDPDVDARADVFALGCVLFRCIAGRPPFEGEDALAVLSKVVLADVPRLGELRDDVPEALEELVSRMLAKSREARPANGREVAAALAALGSLDALPRARPRASETPAGLTAGEQRLVCVILAGDAPDPAAGGPGAVPTLTLLETEVLEKLRAEAAAYGARLEPLANGAVVAFLASDGGAPAMGGAAAVGVSSLLRPARVAATDQVALAARCALALRALLPAVPTALATGIAEVAGRWPAAEAIDRAARLLHLARRDAATSDVHVDEVTVALLDTRFRIRVHGEVRQLCAEDPSAEAPRTLLGRASPCVGRDWELGLLEGIFAQCVEEPVARVVLCTGPPGVGKSRLRDQLVSSIGRRAQVWLARGDPLAVGSPFGMVASLIRCGTGVSHGEPPPLARARIRARLGRTVTAGDLDRLAELLGELIGVPVAEPSVQLRAARSDAALMGDHLRSAWEEWLAAECAVAPLVLVLEDMHWGDRSSASFIDSALRRLAEQPLMVLALGRPEVDDAHPLLWAERGVQRIRVHELTPKASAALVRHAIPDAPSKTVHWLVERAAGNAFYLEELVRAVVEGRGDALPETVLAMAQGRLEGESAEARRILRAASVFGKAFWEAGVAALVGGSSPPIEVGDWLADLTRREVITRRATSRFPGQVELVFRHALLREAAYATLLDADRALGHRLAGAWLEASGETEAAVLAEHFERGGDPARAIAFYLGAAEQALGGSDLAAVLENAHRAARCGAAGETLGRLRLLEAEAHRWSARFAAVERCAVEAMRLLPHRSVAWYAAIGELTHAAGGLARRAVLADLAVELLSIEPDRGEAGPYVIALVRTLIRLVYAGDTALPPQLYARLDRLEPQVAREPSVAARIHIARSQRAMYDGDMYAYLTLSTAALESYTEAGDRRSACASGSDLGHATMEMGGFEEAERGLTRTLAEAERMGLQNVATSARHTLGLVLVHRGRLDEALAVEREALSSFHRSGHARMVRAARVYIARILHARGELVEAEAEARSALGLADTSDAVRALGLAVLADVLLGGDDPAAALAPASAGMAILDERGSIDEGEALLRVVHAEALHAAGQDEAARRSLARARLRLLERAAAITDPRWRASFLERVPENARTISLAAAWGVGGD